MKIKEVELLKRRALSFLEYAKIQLKGEAYDLASFSSEQAAQLYLKSLILQLSGEIPRTHSIRELLRIIGELTNRQEEVKEFIRENRIRLRLLENAYIESRYLPIVYEKEDAEVIVGIAKEVIDFVGSLCEN